MLPLEKYHTFTEPTTKTVKVEPKDPSAAAATYQRGDSFKDEVYEMIFNKTAEPAVLRKWVDGWLPQVRAG